MNFATNPHIRYIVEGMATFFFFVMFLPLALKLSETAFHMLQGGYVLTKWIWRKLTSRSLYARATRGPVAPAENYRRITRAELARLAQEMPEADFKPWKADYLKALALWVAALGWLGLARIGYQRAPDALVATVAVLSGFPAYFGFNFFERGLKCQRGKKFESRAVKYFTKQKPDKWDVVPRHVLGATGDFDLLVRVHTNELCVVEVKRWSNWSGFLRLKRALSQVSGKRRAVGAAYAVVWLPRARTSSAEFNGDVFVVGGNTKYLLEKLPGIIRYFTIVEFPTHPRDLILHYIKMKSFRWNRSTLRWEGRCSQREMDDLKRQVMQHGGTVVSEEPALKSTKLSNSAKRQEEKERPSGMILEKTSINRR